MSVWFRQLHFRKNLVFFRNIAMTIFFLRIQAELNFMGLTRFCALHSAFCKNRNEPFGRPSFTTFPMWRLLTNINGSHGWMWHNECVLLNLRKLQRHNVYFLRSWISTQFPQIHVNCRKNCSERYYGYDFFTTVRGLEKKTHNFL